jgi:organic hydroperoxide reductase OsmC/OhrA
MAEHTAEVHWIASPHPEQPATFSRDHTVRLENGHELLNSSAPAYHGNPAAANPETLLLAALASCHMLTFLAIVSKRGYSIADYSDRAVGTLGKNAEGRMAITHCSLNPSVKFLGDNQPTTEELQRFHDSAHRNCFIANTLNCVVEIAI